MTSVSSLFYLLPPVRHAQLHESSCRHVFLHAHQVAKLLFYIRARRVRRLGTPAVVHHIVIVLRSQVCPRASLSNGPPPYFQSAVPGGLGLSWDLGSLCASKILGDKFIEIGFSIFHELSDLHIGQFLSFRAFPDREG